MTLLEEVKGDTYFIKLYFIPTIGGLYFYKVLPFLKDKPIHAIEKEFTTMEAARKHMNKLEVI